MSFRSRFAVTAFAAATVIAVADPSFAAKKSCAMYGGDATMVTEDLAKFMASAALKNSMTAAAATPSGAVKMTCTSSGLTTCQARQRACK
jgi:hypothetical protein